VILGTQTYKPHEFASQINLNIHNAWGILRSIIDLCLSQPDGKYLIVKDPNKVRACCAFFKIRRNAGRHVGVRRVDGNFRL
jgi:hypothetical protein